MKKITVLLSSLLLLLCACNKATSDIDDAMNKAVRTFWNTYAQEKHLDTICIVKPSSLSDRLYEISYDEGYYLLLANRTDSVITDVLDKGLSLGNPTFIQLTDSTDLINDATSTYTVGNDSLTIKTYTAYILQSRQNSDTLLLELDEEIYHIGQGLFDKVSHTNSVLKDNGQMTKEKFNQLVKKDYDYTHAIYPVSETDNFHSELSQEFWKRIGGYNLSKSVINPDSIYEEIEGDGESLKRYDPLGYRGKGYHKFDIHFSEIVKKNDYEYQVKGLTRCQGEIWNINGILTLDSARVYRDDAERDHDLVPAKINAHYRFDVFKKGTAVALLCGQSEYNVVEKHGVLAYDAQDAMADGYCNNQYEGYWINLAAKDSLVCNWGDFRIPNSKGLDVGCGEFMVNEKWVKNGWQLYANEDIQEYEKDCLWWQQK